MSLKSMTGYGRGEAAQSGYNVELELSSVNRKQFDVRVSLPRQFSSFESRIYEIIHSSISRGYINCSLNIKTSEDCKAKTVSVNMAQAALYIKEIRKAGKKLELKDDLSMGALMSIPGLVSFSDAEIDQDRLWKLIKKALKDAIVHLVDMRKTEGAHLEKDISKRFSKLAIKIEKIKTAAPKVVARYLDNIRDRLSDAGIDVKKDNTQLNREIVILADKMDISEEIVRIESHLKHVVKLMETNKPAGRSLDFLCQELFREINTIGSKCNDSTIAQYVIKFKTELETVREQVQNIE